MDIINKEKILEHAKKLAGEGKLDRAIGEYERLLQLDPSDLRIKLKIAELYVKRKQISDAIRLYKEVAGGYADGGFYLKAVTVYKSILRLNPSLVDVNIALSELYEKMGLVQDALYQYQIAAVAMEQKNDAAGLLSIRERMVAIDPLNISLRMRLAETYQLQGATDKAVDMYESMAKQLKDAGDSEELMELYGKILAHRPERSDLLKKLCQMHFRRGEWKETLKRMDTAKSFVAEDPELLAMQADIYARLNQIETAKGKYRDLAELFLDNGRTEDAVRVYEDILFLGPEDEKDVAKEVEEIKEGAFLTVKSNVEERRRKIADEDAKMEREARMAEESQAKTSAIAKKLGVRPEEVSIGPDKAQKFEKEASASYDLGLMYKKMGLGDEARSEFAKALKIYQRLSGGGVISERSAERLKELEALFPESSAPLPVKKVQPAAKKEVSKKKKISFV